MDKTTKTTKSAPPEQDRTIAKKSEFILMFKKKGFNISVTCEAVGIDRGRYYKWLEDDAFRIAIEYQKEATLDFAESKLLYFMNGGTEDNRVDERLQFNAVQFFLRTKGKIRDYTEKSEVAHSGDMNIQYISHIPKEDEKSEDVLERKLESGETWTRDKEDIVPVDIDGLIMELTEEMLI